MSTPADTARDVDWLDETPEVTHADDVDDPDKGEVDAEPDVARGAQPRRPRFPWVTWTIAALIVITVPLVSVVLMSRQTTTRVAEAEVLAPASQSATTAIQIETAVRTEKVILESRAVILPAASSLGITPEELSDHLDVDVVSGSLALRVRVEHEDPVVALRYIDATVERYIEVNTSSDLAARQQLLRSTINDLTTERLGIEEQLTTLEARNADAETLGVSGNPAEERRLQAESQQLLERVGALEAEVLKLDLELADAEEPIVVSEPHVLPDPIEPNRAQAVTFGLFIGLTAASLLLAGRYQIRAVRHGTANRPASDWP